MYGLSAVARLWDWHLRQVPQYWERITPAQRARLRVWRGYRRLYRALPRHDHVRAWPVRLLREISTVGGGPWQAVDRIPPAQLFGEYSTIWPPTSSATPTPSTYTSSTTPPTPTADRGMTGVRIGHVYADGPRLLLVEDEAELAGMLHGLFVDEGYTVDVAANGQTGLHYGLTRSYDVVVLDRRLPVVEGLELVRTWRRHGVITPILVLSAQGNPAERVEGLDAGAEDYLAKPFDIEELLARLRALQRRHLDQARVLPVRCGHLDLDTREVSGVGDTPVALSERECALLATLAHRPQQVYSRPDLLALVFPEAENPVAVDTYVHYLRRKLGREIVETIRGRGYRLGRR